MVRQGLFTLGLWLMLLLPWQAHAVLTIEITGGSENAMPIAIVPFGESGVPAPENVSEVIKNDLASSGFFAPVDESDLISRPHEREDVNFNDWRLLRTEGLLIGKVSSNDGERYEVQVQLFNVYNGEQMIGKRYRVPASGLRKLSHQIADLIYEELTGEKGIFSTRLAFVTEVKGSDGNKRYALQVADADGANPRTVLQSTQPILSPGWSPDSEQITYVSFENGNTEVFVQDLASGQRRAVASFDGINSAPAWSPDGDRLALTLSRNGNPEIYVLEIDSGDMKRITNNSQAIDTEPVWTPDGNELLFTSDRGGQPQIYRISADGGRAERVTYDGAYNASPDISPDGNYLTMVHRSGNGFSIAVQDLRNDALNVLTEGGQDESPSFAPNGRMILYATQNKGHAVLAAVSRDGRVHQRLSESETVVREPAWSPFRQ